MAYPNVPNVPGVPPLVRNPLAAAAPVISLLTGDTVFGYGADLAPQWGVYSSGGQLVITADTVQGVEFRQEWAIATYPLEQGAFQSYDKVSTPFQAVVSFTSGGNAANRQALLDSIDEISGDLNLYVVVTPEKTYPRVNVQRLGYRRSGGRASGIITVEVGLIEVRVDAGASGSNAQSPSGATPAQDGTVQPGGSVPPTPQSVQEIAAGAGQFSTTSPTGYNPAPVASPGFNLLQVQ